MEQDKQKEREKSLEGKFFTTKASSKNNLVLIKKNRIKTNKNHHSRSQIKFLKNCFFLILLLLTKLTSNMINLLKVYHTVITTKF